MIRKVIGLVLMGLMMALVCDTIPAQDGCETDMECETAWAIGEDFGD